MSTELHPRPQQPDQLEPISPRRGFSLTTALAVAIGSALILTGISTTLYLGSNFSRIDLSKPKNAAIRGKVSAVSDNTSNNSGPITRESIGEAIKKIKAAQADLKKSGSFDTPVLGDTSLGIPAAQ